MNKRPELKQTYLGLLDHPLVGVSQSTLKGDFIYVNCSTSTHFSIGRE